MNQIAFKLETNEIPENKFNSLKLCRTIGGESSEKRPFIRWVMSACKKLGSVFLRGLIGIGRYLKEQNALAIEHHKAIQMQRDEFYSKNYWHIRGL